MRPVNKNRIVIWPYIGIFVFFWLASNIILPYIGLFYETKGYSDSSIGVLSGSFQFMVVLSAILVGWIADRVKRPGPMVFLLTIGMVFAAFLLYKSTVYAATLFCVLLLSFCYAPVNGITDKVLMEKLKEEPQKYAKCRSGGTVGAGLGIIIAGLLLSEDSFRNIFIGFAAALIPCLICSFFFDNGNKSVENAAREKSACGLAGGASAAAAKEQTDVPSSGAKAYRAFLHNKDTVFIYLSLAVWGITESGTGTFQAMLVDDCGYPAALTSVYVVMAMIGEFIGFQLISRGIRRDAYKKALALSFILQLFRIFSMALLGILPLPLIIFFQFTGGGSFAIMYSVTTFLVDETYPGNVLYMAHSLKRVASNGIGNMLGLVFLGNMFDRGLGRQGYMIIAALSVVMLLWYGMKKRPGAGS